MSNNRDHHIGIINKIGILHEVMSSHKLSFCKKLVTKTRDEIRNENICPTNLETGFRRVTVECILQSGPHVLGRSRAAFKLVSQRTFAARALSAAPALVACSLTPTLPLPHPCPAEPILARSVYRLLNRLVQIS